MRQLVTLRAIAIITLLLAATTLSARADVDAEEFVSVPTLMTCKGIDTNGGNLEIGIIKRENSKIGMLVVLDSNLVHKKTVCAKLLTDRTIYSSAEFRNLHHVPSTLWLQVYEKDIKLTGNFSEISFFPELNARGEGLKCETNSQVNFRK